MMLENLNIDIFDITNTGMPDYNEILENEAGGKIIKLTPKQYYQICAEKMGVSYAELYKYKVLSDESTVNQLVKKLEDGVLVNIPVLDFTKPSFFQEGLHRMAAAGECIGWDTPVPVLIVGNLPELKSEDDIEDEDEYINEFEYFKNNSSLVFEDLDFGVYKHNVDPAYLIYYWGGDNCVIIDPQREEFDYSPSDNELIQIFNESPELHKCIQYVYNDAAGKLYIGRLAELDSKYIDVNTALQAARESTKNGILTLGSANPLTLSCESLFETDDSDLELLDFDNRKKILNSIIELDLTQFPKDRFIMYDSYSELLSTLQTIRVLSPDLYIKADRSTYLFGELQSIYLQKDNRIDFTIIERESHRHTLDIHVPRNSMAFQFIVSQVQDYYDDDFESEEQAFAAVEEICDAKIIFS